METIVTEQNQEPTLMKSEEKVNFIGKAKRLKRIEKCIYGVFGIRVLSVLIGYGVALRTLNSLQEQSGLNSVIDILSFSSISGALTFDALLFVLGYFVIQDLKREKAWAWIGAISFFILSAGMIWTIPFVIIGLINTLHEEVRTPFIEKLDF